MRREEWVTVQGPVKKQQPDGMSQGGGGVVERGTKGHKLISSIQMHEILPPTISGGGECIFTRHNPPPLFWLPEMLELPERFAGTL